MPRNKYPEETVKIILDAALKVFSEKGCENATVLDIVGEMGGLSRGAFYHHFKSKEEVLFALVDKLYESVDPFERVKSQTNLNGLEKIKWVLEAFNEKGEYRHLSLQILPLLSNPAVLKKLLDENRDFTTPKFIELIEEGIRDGSLKVKNPAIAAEIFVFLINFWMIPAIYPQNSVEEALQRSDMAKEITNFLGLPVLDDDLTSFGVINEQGLVVEVSKEDVYKAEEDLLKEKEGLP